MGKRSCARGKHLGSETTRGGNVFFKGKLYQQHGNWQCLLIVRILLHRSSLWKVWYIPETFLVSYQQKILIKSNWLSHTQGLNTLGIASDGCNRFRSILFVDAPDLGAIFAENDATDFGMWDEKWCNRLLRLLSAIAFCWHIIEVHIEWESELASEPASE